MFQMFIPALGSLQAPPTSRGRLPASGAGRLECLCSPSQAERQRPSRGSLTLTAPGESLPPEVLSSQQESFLPSSPMTSDSPTRCWGGRTLAFLLSCPRKEAMNSAGCHHTTSKLEWASKQAVGVSAGTGRAARDQPSGWGRSLPSPPICHLQLFPTGAWALRGRW